MRSTLSKLLLGMAPALFIAGSAMAQDTPTAVPKTPSQASESKEQAKVDRDLMAKIRKAIVDDKTLSTSAHNINITAKDGKVMLKGKVNSDVERDAVVSKAKDIAGAANVTDNLTVTPPKSKTGE